MYISDLASKALFLLHYPSSLPTALQLFTLPDCAPPGPTAHDGARGLVHCLARKNEASPRNFDAHTATLCMLDANTGQVMHSLHGPTSRDATAAWWAVAMLVHLVLVSDSLGFLHFFKV